MNSALGTMETNQILKTLGLRAIKHKNYLKKMEKIGRLAEDFMHWVDTIGPAPDSMQDGYDLMHADTRLSRLVTSLSYLGIYEALLDLKVWKDQEVNRFIDIGCGNGFLTHAISMKLKGANGVGVDINGSAVEIAKSTDLQPESGNLSFLAMDLSKKMSSDEKLAIGTFDLSISCMVLGELLHIPLGLKNAAFNLAELTEPGGLFISVERFPDTELQREVLINAFSAAGFELKAKDILEVGDEFYPLTIMAKKGII